MDISLQTCSKDVGNTDCNIGGGNITTQAMCLKVLSILMNFIFLYIICILFIIFKNTCHNYECIRNTECQGRYNKCFQMFCTDTTRKRRLCDDDNDCHRKTHRCVWGKCCRIYQQNQIQGPKPPNPQYDG